MELWSITGDRLYLIAKFNTPFLVNFVLFNIEAVFHGFSANGQIYSSLTVDYRKSSNKRPGRLFKFFDLKGGSVNKKGAFIQKLHFWKQILLQLFTIHCSIEKKHFFDFFSSANGVLSNRRKQIQSKVYLICIVITIEIIFKTWINSERLFVRAFK